MWTEERRARAGSKETVLFLSHLNSSDWYVFPPLILPLAFPVQRPFTTVVGTMDSTDICINRKSTHTTASGPVMARYSGVFREKQGSGASVFLVR